MRKRQAKKLARQFQHRRHRHRFTTERQWRGFRRYDRGALRRNRREWLAWLLWSINDRMCAAMERIDAGGSVSGDMGGDQQREVVMPGSLRHFYGLAYA